MSPDLPLAIRLSHVSKVFGGVRALDDVAFEVDYHDKLSRRGWSILLNGSAARVDADEPALSGADPRRPPEPWAPGDRDLVVRLTPRSISGRRVSKPN